jgi:Holliday junction resolvasome RuvABC DNA-binding subunit
MMVRRLLPGCIIAGADAADALAVAICHAHHAATWARTLSRPGRGQGELAQRIAMELKDKVGGLMLGPAAKADGAAENAAVSDAVSALVNLGYARAEAYGAVMAAAGRLGPQAALDALVRAGLRELGR